MAKIIYDGYEFEIPEGEYSGHELQSKAGAERDAVPVIRRRGEDIVVEPDSRTRLRDGDRVVFTTPMEAG